MLKFFRENAKAIGWVIVIFFGATMFSGGLLFFKSFNQMRSQGTAARELDPAKNVAMVGRIPVNIQKYNELLMQSMTRLQQQAEFQSISPEMEEVARFSAFTQAAQYSILLASAREAKIKVSHKELVGGMRSVYVQYNLRGKKELKELLKKNHYPYSVFIEGLKNDLMVHKFAKQIIDQIIITDKDVDNKYTRIKVRHILVKTDAARSEDEALKMAENITSKIKSGLPFSEEARSFSDDTASQKNGGDLGWIVVGQTVREFESVAFALEKGELSRPVRSAFGYHLILVDARDQSAKPPILNYEEEKKTLLQDRQNHAVSEYVQGVVARAGLTVFEPSLRAYEAKIKGDYQGAINAYQTLVSQYPSNPIPDYLMAKVYWMLGDRVAAKDELNRALIKTQLNPQSASVYIQALAGDMAVYDYVETQMPKAIGSQIKADYKQKENKFQQAVASNKFSQEELSQLRPDLIRMMRAAIARTHTESTLPKQVLADYDKAHIIAGNDIVAYQELKVIYLELGATTRARKVDQEIARITKLIEERVKLQQQTPSENISIDTKDLKLEN